MANHWKPQVVIMGLGYIGLPTASLIASKNIHVTGIDISEKIVDTVNSGNIHIVEPDLLGLVKYTTDKGFLKASTMVHPADVFLIAVPTPLGPNQTPDIKYVIDSIKAIIPVLKPNDLIILESTSPVGTTEKMLELIEHTRPELKNEILMAYCPERVLPGNIIYELEQNDRVIGGIDQKSTQRAIDFYSCFVKGALKSTTVRTAEMCKLAENSFRDLNIAFANELSMICEKAEINPWELIELANCHPRVNILQPGVGVGGHCIAVDPWFIVSSFEKEATLIKTARQVNLKKTQWVIDSILSEINTLKTKLKKDKISVACMGLAFKPNVDDLRESPSAQIAASLQNITEIELLTVEPNLKEHPTYKLLNVKDAIDCADLVVFLTAHREFTNLNPADLQNKSVLDFCRALKV